MDVNESKYEKKSCPRCDTLFTCTSSVHCWCMEYDISEKLKWYLELNFDGCLCRSCLEELINEFDENK